MAGQRVGRIRAADQGQFGSERAKPLDLLRLLDRLTGVDGAQRCPVKQPIESRLGDRSQVLTLTARKIQVEPGQGMRRRERASTGCADD